VEADAALSASPRLLNFKSNRERQVFDVVADWIIFLFIVFVIAVDDILHELLWSFATTRAAVLDRLKSLRGKLRSLWRGAHG
jgi:hypothetical protein